VMVFTREALAHAAASARALYRPLHEAHALPAG